MLLIHIYIFKKVTSEDVRECIQNVKKITSNYEFVSIFFTGNIERRIFTVTNFHERKMKVKLHLALLITELLFTARHKNGSHQAPIFFDRATYNRRIAVITVEPAGKASFVLGCIQTRLMG